MNLPVLSLEQRLDLWFEYADTYGRQGNTEKALTWFEKVPNAGRFFVGSANGLKSFVGNDTRHDYALEQAWGSQAD